MEGAARSRVVLQVSLWVWSEVVTCGLGAISNEQTTSIHHRVIPRLSLDGLKTGHFVWFFGCDFQQHHPTGFCGNKEIISHHQDLSEFVSTSLPGSFADRQIKTGQDAFVESVDITIPVDASVELQPESVTCSPPWFDLPGIVLQVHIQ